MNFCEQFNHFHYDVILLLELIPPVLICLTIWRISSSPSRYMWTVIVIHTNILLWTSIIITFSTYNCKGDAIQKLWSNFVVVGPLATIINLIAALGNDQSYPVARYNIAEAKVDSLFIIQYSQGSPLRYFSLIC